jgi:hypothetical protein
MNPCAKQLKTAKRFGLQINIGALLQQNTGEVFVAMFFVVNNDGFDFHVFFRFSVYNPGTCI